MQSLMKIFTELFGLFVENGSFALAILIWLGIVWLAAPHMAAASDASGTILFGGLVLILIENTIRSSRRKQAHRGNDARR